MFTHKLEFILLPHHIVTLNNYAHSPPPLANVSGRIQKYEAVNISFRYFKEILSYDNIIPIVKLLVTQANTIIRHFYYGTPSRSHTFPF